MEEETSRVGLRIGLETCGGAEREVEGTGVGVWSWTVTQHSQGGLGWPVVRPGGVKMAACKGGAYSCWAMEKVLSGP